jgi:DTW domain-containing protein YfiP
MRGQRVARCRVCGVPPTVCVCRDVVPERVETRVVIVMHHTERHKSTNTARLLAHAVEGAVIRVRGLRDAPPGNDDGPPGGAEGPTGGDDAPVAPSGGLGGAAAGAGPPRRLVLFPRAGARPLVPADRGSLLLVPDGTWPQAHRAARREPSMRDAEAVTLPGAHDSRFVVRSTPHAGRLSTFEAVAEALGVLEGPEVRARLLALFERFVERARGVRDGRYR